MDSQETLLDLLARTALKDRAAFRELYDHSSARLFGVLLRILKNEMQAEDALQEAYIQIWKRAGDYRPDKGTPLGWMTAIARYRALDMKRRHKTDPSVDDSEAQDQTADDQPDLADYFGMLGEGKVAWRCLQELPEEARDCIVMAYVEGYTHVELAERFDTPVGTIKSWIRRGTMRLKKCMEEENE